MGKVTVENKIYEFGERTTKVFDEALGRMAKDIVQVTKITIPFLGGDLMKAVKKEKLGILEHRVVIDEEYASYQERGKRATGSHVVKKYTTPGTGPHFLEKAGDKITSQAIQYLKQANQLIRMSHD